MRVLGASGFIGRRVVAALLAGGHEVIPAGRQMAVLQRLFPACAAVQADLACDAAADWPPRMAGVNLAGILRGVLEQVQHRGPVSLFDAGAAVGVKHLLHVSALESGAAATFICWYVADPRTSCFLALLRHQDPHRRGSPALQWQPHAKPVHAAHQRPIQRRGRIGDRVILPIHLPDDLLDTRCHARA